MKLVLIALSAILAVSTARVVIIAQDPGTPHLLGSDECTWGPSYWCENLKSAAGCNATKHCIKKVWGTMTVPEDNDSVCNVCKDMVQQARDQLESNQTQNDLKAVFEGSCALIHIKPIVKECVTLVDQFIPELVETLASQMNPSVVCSVAGLCNSAHFDKLLSEYEETVTKVPKINGIKPHALENDELEPDECSKCYTVAAHMEHKLTDASQDEVLKHMLNLCGEFDTFSDACSATVVTYFNHIYSHLKDNFKADNICHLSGQCSAKFHKHDNESGTGPNVEVTPLSSVGMVEVGDDLPCKLCEQLVGHLRDLLVANTTESEFEKVLEGFCKQTKSFASECTAIVDEYYPQIYDYLTKGLNSNMVCQMSGICPAPGYTGDKPVWPLLPPKQTDVSVRLLKKAKKNMESEEMKEVEAMQLPIELMVPFPVQRELSVNGKESCALCEYILHFLQEQMTNPSNENKVKKALEKVCSEMPAALKGECNEFVDTYGDAVVAILADEIDPSQVCPTLHLCPSTDLMKMWELAAKKGALQVEEKDKPSCPLCLLAVTQVYNTIKNNKTEANIEAELDKLCSHLPKSLIDECTDLVKGYSKELVEMLLADLTPQEVCVYIKLCDATTDPGPRPNFSMDKDGEIMTNEIPQYPLYPEKQHKVKTDVTCIICEFVMQYVDKALGTKKSKSEIEKAVHKVCKYLPKTVSEECNQFVDEYGDTLIDILSEEVSPKEACALMNLCKVDMAQMQASVAECALCQAILSTIDNILGDPKVDIEIEDAVAKACKYLPASKRTKCISMIEVYGQSIINLIRQHDNSKKICSKMALCSSNDYLALSIKSSRMRRSYDAPIGTKRCTWGASYWCSNNETARECKAEAYCKEKHWKAEVAPASKQPTLNKAETSA